MESNLIKPDFIQIGLKFKRCNLKGDCRISTISEQHNNVGLEIAYDDHRGVIQTNEALDDMILNFKKRNYTVILPKLSFRKVGITGFILLLFLSTLSFAQTTVPLCSATYKDGTACHNKAVVNGYCNMHNPAAFKCGATTKAGTPCKRNVKIQGTHCRQHQNENNSKN